MIQSKSMRFKTTLETLDFFFFLIAWQCLSQIDMILLSVVTALSLIAALQDCGYFTSTLTNKLFF